MEEFLLTYRILPCRWDVYIWLFNFTTIYHLQSNFQGWFHAWPCTNNNIRAYQDAWFCHYWELCNFHGSFIVCQRKGIELAKLLQLGSITSRATWNICLNFDFQEMVTENKLILKFDTTKKARFGVLPRYAKEELQIRWFELPSCFIFHNSVLVCFAILLFCQNVEWLGGKF